MTNTRTVEHSTRTRRTAPLGAATVALVAICLSAPLLAQDVQHEAALGALSPDSLDRLGASVGVSGGTAVVGAPDEDSAALGVNGSPFNNSSDASGAAYVFTRTQNGWSQQAYLKASNTDPSDQFGYAVAIDGDTIAIGAPFEDGGDSGVNGNPSDNSESNSGAVYVFQRNQGVWSQTAYLKSSAPQADYRFGSVIALSGDLLVVGAPVDNGTGQGVGSSPGASGVPQSGGVFVFRQTSGSWTQEEFMKASNAESGDQFGTSVATDSERILVGAPGEDGDGNGVGGDPLSNASPQSGAAYLFSKSGGQWQETAYIKAPNTDIGDDFGESVSISGNLLLIGAPSEASADTDVNGDMLDNSLPGAGAAYVYLADGNQCAFQSYLKSSSTDAYDFFGKSVSVSGYTACVGAWKEDGSSNGVGGDGTDNSALSSGAAFAFVGTGPNWLPRAYLKSTNAHAGAFFGKALALDGSTLIVGAEREDSGAGEFGAAHVYKFPPVESVPFCLGDGSGQPCPCGNSGYPGEGCANSTGGGAQLFSEGSNVVALDDVTLRVIARRPTQPGVFIQGGTQISIPYKDGHLCVGPPTERLEVVFLDAFGFGESHSSIAAEGNATPGQTLYYQFWYRDPGGISPCGESSNLSNGLIIVWQ